MLIDRLDRILLAAIASVAAPAGALAQSVLFAEDFESGLGAWTVTHPATCGGFSCSGGVTWNVIADDSDCASWAAPFPFGPQCARFGHSVNCDFDGDNNAIPTAELRSTQSIALPVAGSITLRFSTTSQAEDNGSDLRTVEVVHPGLPAPVVLATLTSSGWHEQSVDLTPYAGNGVQVIFRFRCLDSNNNAGNGWLVDHVRIEAATSVGFCAGDGSATACPCGNAGATGHGCASSIDPTGAFLTATGNPQVSGDNVILGATGLSNSVVLFFQGTGQLAGGQGVVFGDGLRCAGGTITRLAGVLTSSGVAHYPGPVDPPLHVAGSVPAGGGVRTYQVWYRNSATFCTPLTFNLSNGQLVSWLP